MDFGDIFCVFVMNFCFLKGIFGYFLVVMGYFWEIFVGYLLSIFEVCLMYFWGIFGLKFLGNF